MTSLESFRNEWKKELTGKRESDAIDLWLQAEAYEADGDLGKAISLYSRAEKLDSDVFTKVRQSRPERVKPVFGGDYEKVSKSNVEDDLQKTLQSLKISSLDSGSSPSRQFDDPDFTPMMASKPSLVDFPTEVIQKVMKKLASSGHLITIGRLSRVCKFLYNQAEDEGLWKLACRNFFDPETLEDLYELNGNYKTCYLKTPKPNLSDGVYVGKQSYWREGEQRGWTNITQHVTYRRYLRFFPDNYLVVVCSAEDPKFIMRKIFSNDLKKLSGVKYGRWHFFPTEKRIEIDITDEQHSKLEISKIVFSLEKNGRQLDWVYYSCTEFKNSTESTFELPVSEFPALELYRK